MSGYIYVTVMLSADDEHHGKAHRSHLDGDVIASVDIDAPGRGCIQSSAPGALRKLAEALIAAEDEADRLRAEAVLS